MPTEVDMSQPCEDCGLTLEECWSRRWLWKQCWSWTGPTDDGYPVRTGSDGGDDLMYLQD